MGIGLLVGAAALTGWAAIFSWRGLGCLVLTGLPPLSRLVASGCRSERNDDCANRGYRRSGQPHNGIDGGKHAVTRCHPAAPCATVSGRVRSRASPFPRLHRTRIPDRQATVLAARRGPPRCSHASDARPRARAEPSRTARRASPSGRKPSADERDDAGEESPRGAAAHDRGDCVRGRPHGAHRSEGGRRPGRARAAVPRKVPPAGRVTGRRGTRGVLALRRRGTAGRRRENEPKRSSRCRGGPRPGGRGRVAAGTSAS